MYGDQRDGDLRKGYGEPKKGAEMGRPEAGRRDPLSILGLYL